MVKNIILMQLDFHGRLLLNFNHLPILSPIYFAKKSEYLCIKIVKLIKQGGCVAKNYDKTANLLLNFQIKFLYVDGIFDKTQLAETVLLFFYSIKINHLAYNQIRYGVDKYLIFLMTTNCHFTSYTDLKVLAYNISMTSIQRTF